MRSDVIRIHFYERPQPLTIPVFKDDYGALVDKLKLLAAGVRDIPAYFALKLSSKTAILISIKDVVALHCLNGDEVEAPTLDGACLYLRHLPSAVEVAFDEQGPYADLILELSETGYEESPQGCVMLPDSSGGFIFFRPDDIQYALFDTRYANQEAYKPR